MKENNSVDAHCVSRHSFLLVACCSHPLPGCRQRRQAEGMDPGGMAPRSMYSQPFLHYPARQDSQTLPTAPGLAPALRIKRHSQNVPKTLMPKDPWEVGTTKLFLPEIFSGMPTQAQAASEHRRPGLCCRMALPSASSSDVGPESIQGSVSSSCLVAASC